MIYESLKSISFMQYTSRPGSLYDIATAQLNRVLIASKLTIISEGFPRVLEVVPQFSCYAITEHNRPIADNAISIFQTLVIL